MNTFKVGDAIVWYKLECSEGDSMALYYKACFGFVVNTTEHGCIVGENETGQVYWFDNSRLRPAEGEKFSYREEKRPF